MALLLDVLTVESAECGIDDIFENEFWIIIAEINASAINPFTFFHPTNIELTWLDESFCDTFTFTIFTCRRAEYPMHMQVTYKVSSESNVIVYAEMVDE